MYVRIKNVFMDIGVYVYASLRELICKTVFAFACACACACFVCQLCSTLLALRLNFPSHTH